MFWKSSTECNTNATPTLVVRCLTLRSPCLNTLRICENQSCRALPTTHNGRVDLIQFAKRLKAYWRGIVSRVRWPMHTGQLEGINNRIKVIKRMAYGYRDSEFFFMKIKSVFPGNP
jgi:hypothetical protein